MRNRYAVVGIGLVLAAAIAVPALSSEGDQFAQTAGGGPIKMAKRALRIAKTARVTANAAQGQIRWAIVSADGTISAQTGGISTEIDGGGEYVLNFGSPMTNYNFQATVNEGDPGNATAALCGGPGNPGGINCGAGPGTNLVAVTTYPLDTSAESPRPFYIAAIPRG